MLSKSPKETEQIAKIFLGCIQKEKRGTRATVVALSGDLGAGKTAFTKAAAKHLGIRQKVSSPTFVLIKKYPLKEKSHKYFFHIDAYRLKNEKELIHLGWPEIVNNSEHLVFIEWSENVKKIIPKEAKFVHFSTDKNTYRHIKFK